ncbi:MAG: glycosyltransferase family 2 protein [Chloroflexi bacterium]|nr:glycosyltransferase family 2 protein [Chloroflexota bacterium]
MTSPTDEIEQRSQSQRDERFSVAIVIPTYNGAHLLPVCLDAVAGQTRAPEETIVVDDGSTDDTPGLLAQRYPWVRLVRRDCNRGFVAAVNLGIASTRCDVVVLLNNDTEPESGWLAALVAPLERDPTIGSCASKLLLFDRRDHLHSAGDGYTVGGVPVNRGAWTRDDGRYDRSEFVFGACAGAAAYRRELLCALGGFDEWLVSYLEDTDLSWRLQLQGHRCRYVPEARVYHQISATGGGIRPSYFCGRNFPLVLASDVPAPLLRKYWRAILREQGSILLEAMRHAREPAARARLRGFVAGLVQVPAALRRRARIQRTRRAGIDYLDALLTR